MRFFFDDKKLQALYTEEKDAHKYPSGIVKSFFEVLAIIDAAKDDNDLYMLKGLHYERLKGKRKHQRSIRLNKQFRLILEREEDETGKYFWIIAIEDYH